MFAALAISLAALASADERPTSPAKEDASRRGSDEEPALTAQEILANPLDDDAYSNTTRCLATVRYRRIDILSERALVFQGRGGVAWLNLLPRRCPGLRPDMALIIEQPHFRVCAMNRFRGLSQGSVELGSSFCTLGRFERMTMEQVRARTDALLAEQRNRVVRRTIRSAERHAAAERAARGQAGGGRRDHPF